MTITRRGADSSGGSNPTRNQTAEASELPSNDIPHGDNDPMTLYASAYSGADIKLVVHLPAEESPSQRIEAQRIESEMIEIEDQLSGMEDGPERTQLLRELADLSDSFSEAGGTDASASVTKALAEIQTLSLSIHREKFPVRTLGSVYPRSITRGPRTLSGSVVFTHFHRHVFDEFFGAASYRSSGVGDFDRYRWTTQVMDQLPPLDISIVFANEYGNLSWMSILGVEFMNEGMVMSIEDLFVEGTAQYIARDWDPIRSVANRPISPTRGVGEQTTGGDLLASHLTQRVSRRRNPFI